MKAMWHKKKNLEDECGVREGVIGVRGVLEKRIREMELKEGKTYKECCEGSKRALSSPCGQIFSVDNQSLTYCFELDHSLKTTCLRLSEFINHSQDEKSEQHLADVTALKSICDTILFFITPDFNLSHHSTLGKTLFSTVNSVLFNQKSFK